MAETTRQRAKGLWPKAYGSLLIAGLMAASAAAALTAQSVDVRAAEAAMMTADREFNQAVADHDLVRFLSLVAEDASFEAADARGRDAVGKAWAPFFQEGGPQIAWQPTKAEVLVGGDVGFTQGAWTRRSRDAGGALVVTQGTYLTVWRKQKDGAWRAVFDTGSTQK
jgi:ketosteroid isomerase-like protein